MGRASRSTLPPCSPHTSDVWPPNQSSALSHARAIRRVLLPTPQTQPPHTPPTPSLGNLGLLAKHSPLLPPSCKHLWTFPLPDATGNFCLASIHEASRLSALFPLVFICPGPCGKTCLLAKANLIIAPSPSRHLADTGRKEDLSPGLNTKTSK